MIKSVLFLSFTVLLFSCSSSKVSTDKNRMPIGVVCDDHYNCEVADPFKANIDVIKKCLATPYPEAIKNYDGHSLVVRDIDYEMFVMKSSLRMKISAAVVKYFNILAQIYYQKYGKSFDEYLNRFLFYKESTDKKLDEITQKVFMRADLSGINMLLATQMSGNAVGCAYFNINSYMKRFFKMMPKTLEKNIDTLLAETTQRFNQEVKADKKLNDKQNIEVDFNFKQKYHHPTQQQIMAATERLKNEIPLFISFCQEVYTLDQKLVTCTTADKKEIDIVDLFELSYLPFLTTIDLRGSEIKNLKPLRYIESLQRIFIFSEQKDEDSLKELAEKRPNLKVIVQGEKELNRKNELVAQLEKLESRVNYLKKRLKRRMSRRKRRTYKAEWNTLQDKIKPIKEEIEKLDIFLKKEADRLEKKREKLEKQNQDA